jgi:hypothetical protein
MNPAATFTKGDRVQLSPLGLARLRRRIGGKINGQLKKASTTGVVAWHQTEARNWSGEIYIIPDGRKSVRRVNALFWEKVPSTLYATRKTTPHPKD